MFLWQSRPKGRNGRPGWRCGVRHAVRSNDPPGFQLLLLGKGVREIPCVRVQTTTRAEAAARAGQGRSAGSPREAPAASAAPRGAELLPQRVRRSLAGCAGTAGREAEPGWAAPPWAAGPGEAAWPNLSLVQLSVVKLVETACSALLCPAFARGSSSWGALKLSGSVQRELSCLPGSPRAIGSLPCAALTEGTVNLLIAGATSLHPPSA